MYERFYHLDLKPFALMPDARFFFASGGHHRVLSYLRYGIHQGEGFIVVTGEIGTGKTTLIQTLLEQIRSNAGYVIAHLVTSQVGPGDVVHLIAAAFGVPCDGLGKSQVLQRLHAFLVQKARERKRALLVVDEAQNIPPETLEEIRMLSNLQVDRRPLLQGCLLGQSEFRDMLASGRFEQLRQRIVASYHLGPMSAAETRGYVEHRLRLAGWRDDPEIVDGAFAAIFELTAGTPRRINTLCDRVLLYGSLEGLHRITPEVVATVAAELHQELAPPVGGTPAAATPAAPLSATLEARLAAIEAKLGTIEKAVDCRELMKLIARVDA